MANPKSPAWYGGDLSGVIRPGAALGNVYYVDGSAGDNTNTGLRVDVPVLTIKQALSLCVSGNNDTIVVLKYPEAGDVAGEDIPIVVNKDCVSILGAGAGYVRADKYIFLCSGTTDAEVFSIQARNVEIAYLKLAGGVSGACITFGGAGVASKAAAIHHCTFGQKNAPAGAPTYGITFPTLNTGNWCYIGECYFGSSLTSHGIYMAPASNPAWVRIERNVFVSVAGDGINNASGGNYGTILDNRFSLPSNTQGMAITFTAAGAGQGWFIDGNSANYGKTAMGANPYEDSSIGGGHDWGMNHKANTHVLPV